MSTCQRCGARIRSEGAPPFGASLCARCSSGARGPTAGMIIVPKVGGPTGPGPIARLWRRLRGRSA
jgi:hypothetical protein